MHRCRLFSQNQGIYLKKYIHTSNKALTRSSPIILPKSVLTCRKAELAFFIWVLGEGRGFISLYIVFITLTHLTDT